MPTGFSFSVSERMQYCAAVSRACLNVRTCMHIAVLVEGCVVLGKPNVIYDVDVSLVHEATERVVALGVSTVMCSGDGIIQCKLARMQKMNCIVNGNATASRVCFADPWMADSDDWLMFVVECRPKTFVTDTPV